MVSYFKIISELSGFSFLCSLAILSQNNISLTFSFSATNESYTSISKMEHGGNVAAPPPLIARGFETSLYSVCVFVCFLWFHV